MRSGRLRQGSAQNALNPAERQRRGLSLGVCQVLPQGSVSPAVRRASREHDLFHPRMGSAARQTTDHERRPIRSLCDGQDSRPHGRKRSERDPGLRVAPTRRSDSSAKERPDLQRQLLDAAPHHCSSDDQCRNEGHHDKAPYESVYHSSPPPGPGPAKGRPTTTAARSTRLRPTTTTFIPPSAIRRCTTSIAEDAVTAAVKAEVRLTGGSTEGCSMAARRDTSRKQSFEGNSR